MSDGMYFRDSILEEMKINACSERKLYLIEEFDRESVFKIIRRLDKIVSLDINIYFIIWSITFINIWDVGKMIITKLIEFVFFCYGYYYPIFPREETK
jgi:hypothetical protein